MKILGIFRGFPGLGRVVGGVSLLEEMRKIYGHKIKLISYLQGSKYLESRGYPIDCEAGPLDYCSIGLLPTNNMGAYIHSTIRNFNPDVVLIDGEPLIVHSLRVSYPKLKICVLLNPADVENPSNEMEAMDFFNSMYAKANLAIVHGLRIARTKYQYPYIVSIPTIIRAEIASIKNIPSNIIYCLLGGGTVNTSNTFVSSSLDIVRLSLVLAKENPMYTVHVVCSSDNIYDVVSQMDIPQNVEIHGDILSAEVYYKSASLIITRSGRNTLSELLYLGIPTISFITGDKYRSEEQKQNIASVNGSNIHYVSSDIPITEFLSIGRYLLNENRVSSNSFKPGNDIALECLQNLLKK